LQITISKNAAVEPRRQSIQDSVGALSKIIHTIQYQRNTHES